MKKPTVDVMELRSLDEHPRVVDARAELDGARAHHAHCERGITDADRELADAEADAVVKRDDRRLQRAQEACQTARSDMRIADAGLRRASDLFADTRRDVECEVADELHRQRQALVRTIDPAVAALREPVLQLRAIEDRFHALLPTSLYQRTDLPLNERRQRIQSMARCADILMRMFGAEGIYMQWRSANHALLADDIQRPA